MTKRIVILFLILQKKHDVSVKSPFSILFEILKKLSFFVIKYIKMQTINN